jgi:hypothetical protein
MARWIRGFFANSLVGLADKTMILDWHHLAYRRRRYVHSSIIIIVA